MYKAFVQTNRFISIVYRAHHGTATSCIAFFSHRALWLIHNRIADFISFSIKSDTYFHYIMSYLDLNNNTTRTMQLARIFNFSLHFIEYQPLIISAVFHVFLFLQIYLWYFHLILIANREPLPRSAKLTSFHLIQLFILLRWLKRPLELWAIAHRTRHPMLRMKVNFQW